MEHILFESLYAAVSGSALQCAQQCVAVRAAVCAWCAPRIHTQSLSKYILVGMPLQGLWECAMYVRDSVRTSVRKVRTDSSGVLAS
jgi:hypothetical protein